MSEAKGRCAYVLVPFFSNYLPRESTELAGPHLNLPHVSNVEISKLAGIIEKSRSMFFFQVGRISCRFFLFFTRSFFVLVLVVVRFGCHYRLPP